jgi:hypothetical protein
MMQTKVVPATRLLPLVPLLLMVGPTAVSHCC